MRKHTHVLEHMVLEIAQSTEQHHCQEYRTASNCMTCPTPCNCAGEKSCCQACWLVSALRRRLPCCCSFPRPQCHEEGHDGQHDRLRHTARGLPVLGGQAPGVFQQHSACQTPHPCTARINISSCSIASCHSCKHKGCASAGSVCRSGTLAEFMAC